MARALQLVDKDVQWVGKGGRFAKGTPDKTIADALAAEGRYMYTRNLDMMLDWADVGGQFIWLDPQDEPTKYVQAKIIFNHWERWERALADPEVDCLQVGRAKCNQLPLGEARERVQKRYEKQQQAKARKARRLQESSAQEQLDFPDED